MSFFRRRKSRLTGQWCEICGEPRAKLEGTANASDLCLQIIRFLGADFRQENFLVLWLDARNKPMGGKIVSVGTLTSALVYAREVFGSAIDHRAAQIVLCHNHPSGVATPSPEDNVLEDRMWSIGQLLGIPVLDSIVVTAGGSYASCGENAGRNKDVRPVVVAMMDFYGKGGPGPGSGPGPGPGPG